MRLESILSQFKEASDEKELQKSFRALAPAFLYGGYIQVGNYIPVGNEPLK